jgi:hypothetical protein
MVRRTFAQLATDLRMRRAVGDKPPVLLLGAGASVDAGIGAMKELFQFFGCADFPAFCTYIGQTTPAERYRYLSDFLQTRKPAEVSPGYRALATLCAQNYFDVVLTTNMDPLLDDALAAARLWRRDYLLIINGLIRRDRLELLLGGQSPRVKVIKLHGDLFQRFMAWTPAEMDAFLVDIAPFLKPAVAGRDFLVVGYSLRDERVRELVAGAGGSIWFTHPEREPEFLADRETMRAVVAPECKFETFFPSLATALEVAVPSERLHAAQLELRAASPPAAGAQTMDDLMSSVFAIAGPGSMASSTAFLLAEPRIIVGDTYAMSPSVKGGQVEIIAAGGQRFNARVIGHAEHPFGPSLAEPPAELQVPGLRLSATPMKAGDRFQVVVQAGAKTGISSGKVRRLLPAPVDIQPIGAVKDLAELECFVAPGASGAPVVDDSLAVRGFIVAGSSDPDQPTSFAYTADHWAAALGGPKRASGKPRRPKRR